MKVIILAGGLGTRFAEETEIRPKPMIEIGGYPILWHIMKIYSHHGFKDFYIALGYKGEIIKKFFYDYHLLSGNLSINFSDRHVNTVNSDCEDWMVHLVETGQNTLTGGRVKRLKDLIGNETFMVTYGDGVSNVDVQELVKFHKSHGKLATVTAVRPPARYGELLIADDATTKFSEKPQTHEGWINGGFLVFEPQIFEYLSGDKSVLEIEALERLANEGNLVAYKHYDFWQCMDTLRDKRQLEQAWEGGTPAWKIW